jgi:hypothetical protein
VFQDDALPFPVAHETEPRITVPTARGEQGWGRCGLVELGVGLGWDDGWRGYSDAMRI